MASSELSAESRALAGQIFRTPVDSLSSKPWAKAVGADLRKLAIQILQRHLEKKLVTASMLEKGEF
jgi:DNA repair protein RecO (recombination protein O)